MKMTLLDIVQSILSSMDSDEVNSINDTVEATQVATIVRDNYNYIISRLNYPSHHSLVELEASLDPNLPNVMFRPDGLLEIDWLAYNKKRLTWKPLDTFLEDMYSMDPSLTPNMIEVSLTEGTSTIPMHVMTDRDPTYYTTYNDRTILFDAFNANESTTLVKDRSMAYGECNTQFQMVDTFVPPLDHNHFPLLLNESKAQAFEDLKSTPSPNAERKLRKGWIRSQLTKRATKTGSPLDRLPNYARKV